MAIGTKYPGGCLIIDNGSSVELARRLVPFFDQVYYYSEWKQGGFPHSKNYQVGVGIPGVTRVKNLDEYILANIVAKEQGKPLPISLFIFTDVYNGDKQVLLDHFGFNVFGSRYGEELELDRDGLKKLLKHLGLPVGPYKSLKGLDAVADYLKTHENQYIKLSTFRGDTETFAALNFKDRENYIDSLKADLGALKNQLSFMSEDELPDMIEVGVDLQVCDGKYPEVIMGGVEIKDCGYASIIKPYREFPKEITIVTDKLAPTFKHFNYRGNFSNEIRIGKDKQPYLMDSTTRNGNPPEFTQMFAYENLAETYMQTAMGNPVSPKSKFKYYCELIIKSAWGEKNEQYVEIDEKFRDNFFFKNLTIIDNEMYIIPHQIGMQECGSVVAGGNTIDEAFAAVEKIGKELKGSELSIPFDKIDNMHKEMEEMDKLGLNFFNG